MKETNDLKFDWNICGHKNIVHFLQSAISNSSVAHAYLFVGPAHLGKQTLAREFIASLLCNENDLPCRKCVNCNQLKNSVHPDFYTIEKEINEKTGKLRKEIVIDQIRDLKGKMQQATLLNGYKVSLITDAHLMNNNASNGLLKLLEEPTKNTAIILLADNITGLPQTIVSRCQVIKFLPVATADIAEYLGSKTIDAKMIAKQSYGRPGTALSLASDSEFAKEINDNIDNFFKTMEMDLSNRFMAIDTLIDFDKDEAINASRLDSLLSDWRTVVRDMMLIKSDNERLISNTNHLPKIKAHASTLDFPKLRKILKRMDITGDYIWHNINSKSALENLIINL